MSFKEINDNISIEKINLIKNYFNNLVDEINFSVSNIESFWWKETNFSKNKIKKYLRKLSLELVRTYNFLEFFDLKNSENNLSENIEKILNQKTFFNEIKSFYFITENQSSGILVRRFGFNEKSLNRRQPQEIKEELKIEKENFEKLKNEKINLEEKRQKMMEEFDKKEKQDEFRILLDQEKIKIIREKEEKTEEDENFLEKVNESFKELKEKRNNNEEIKEITNSLNNIKKKYWNSKVKVNNLEKELENNLSLTHFAKLLTKKVDWEDLYYLALIPIKNKNILDTKISEIWDTKILKYNSLTFDSLRKLALSYDWTMWIYWDEVEKINKKTWLKRWIVDLYNDIKDDKNLQDFYKLKRYIKNLLKTYNSIFNIYFNFKKLDNANNIEDFIKEFNKQSYKISWENIDFEILKKLEKEEKIELYQIYTKDFFKDQDFFDTEYSIKEQKEERLKRRKDKNVNWNKNLFSAYWENFINDVEKWNFDFRLNSDWWFYIKLAEDLWEKEWKSRKKRDKIISSFNLIFNPYKTLWNSKEEKENIKDFNKLYKKEIKKDFSKKTFIWLDRWEYELLTYCIIDKNLNCIKDENGKYLLWDFNCINSKWEFIKKEDCIYVDKNWKEYKDLIWDFLPTFSQWKENITQHKKSYKFDEKLNLYYFTLNHDAKFYILEWEKARYKITNKNWEEIFLKDRDGNKVINYYLILKSEIYKRYILNDKETEKRVREVRLEDIQDIRWWYISNIIKQLNIWIEKYNSVIWLENLDKIQFDKFGNIKDLTNKEEIMKKTFGVTIYQEIENLLNKKYNYTIFKDSWKISQLTPKVKNISDIKNLEKSSKDINLWNLIFIDESLTSKECPNCSQQLERIKKWWDFVLHTEKFPGNNCKFDTWKIKREVYWLKFIKSWDDLAAYNIAKKAKEYLEELIKKS